MSRVPSPERGDLETSYRELANALPQIVWTVSADGVPSWLNERWYAYTGQRELNPSALIECVHPSDRPEVQARWAEAIRAGTECSFEYRLRAHDGNYRWHLGRVVPVLRDDGTPAHWIATATDIDDQKRVEEALRASDHRFFSAFHQNPQPTAITRLSDGRYIDVNDAFLEMTGYARSEVIGKTPVELGVWSREQRERIVAPLAESARMTDYAIPYRTRDGRARTLKASSARIELAGEPCILSVATDVTERLLAEEALLASEARARARAEELSALMDAVPAAVWVTYDTDAQHVGGSRAAYEMVDVPVHANLSKSASDASALDHVTFFRHGRPLAPEHLPLQFVAKSGTELRDYELELRFATGQQKFLIGSTVPLRDEQGGPRGAIAAFVDITRLKHAEEALREADRRKDEFLAMLSHELRNPLAPILTAVHLMKLRGDVSTPTERQVIERQAQHLVRLVDDLLDVSRVARGKIDLRRAPVELARVVVKAVEATITLFEQKHHSLAVDVPERGLLVHGDEDRLVQVVCNLLTNAARYTPPEGRIRLHAGRDGDSIVLEVRDNGIGIDAQLLPHVFELFVQGPRGPDRAEGGLGLGLALVANLTELHGGSVRAESAGPGQGSTFTVTLPGLEEREELSVVTRAPTQPTPALAHDSQRVLIVDDNEDAATMLSLLLKRAGYDVRIAFDPPEALTLVETFTPSIAILDIGLPVMDGYELARELRGRLGERPPTLIALSGYGQEQDKKRSQESGFALHLVKPVDAPGLLQAIKELTAPLPE